MSPAKVRRRRHYLKALVELDESCQEVIELVEMLLEKGIIMCNKSVGFYLSLSLSLSYHNIIVLKCYVSFIIAPYCTRVCKLIFSRAHVRVV